mmetsp:Transcript_36377/g.89514  ORF Transcript_36377/g.89514 Transcript_36377/m.89514 type:complete len:245 (-) Transcript_36377:960-1694(-)
MPEDDDEGGKAVRARGTDVLEGAGEELGAHAGLEGHVKVRLGLLHDGCGEGVAEAMVPVRAKAHELQAPKVEGHEKRAQRGRRKGREGAPLPGAVELCEQAPAHLEGRTLVVREEVPQAVVPLRAEAACVAHRLLDEDSRGLLALRREDGHLPAILREVADGEVEKAWHSKGLSLPRKEELLHVPPQAALPVIDARVQLELRAGRGTGLRGDGAGADDCEEAFLELRLDLLAPTDRQVEEREGA